MTRRRMTITVDKTPAPAPPPWGDRVYPERWTVTVDEVDLPARHWLVNATLDYQAIAGGTANIGMPLYEDPLVFDHLVGAKKRAIRMAEADFLYPTFTESVDKATRHVSRVYPSPIQKERIEP